MKRALTIAPIALALVFAAGCSGKKSPGSGPCSITHGGTAGPTAQFNADPGCYANPFPTDLLLGSNGRVSIPARRLDYVLPSTATYGPARTHPGTGSSSLGAGRLRTAPPIW